MNKQLPEKEVIYFKESLIESILSDLFTIGLLIAGFFANRFYFHEKWYIYVFFMVLFFIITLSRSSKISKRFSSKKKLIEYLEEQHEK